MIDKKIDVQQVASLVHIINLIRLKWCINILVEVSI